MNSYAATSRVLMAQGVMDEQGVTRRPRPGHCARCRLAVTAAISDAGFTVLTWPTPTTVTGELTALMSGRTTWTAHDGDLLYRTAERITGNHPDRARVLVEHRCGDPPPEGNAMHVKAKTFVFPVDPPF